MADKTSRDRLLKQRRRAARQAPELAELMRGTLRERYVRCGKPGCHCREGRGHGPVRYLSVSLGKGKTRQITITAEDYELARRYVDNYERLWEVMETISGINLELFQQRLLSPDDVPKRRKRKRSVPDE